MSGPDMDFTSSRHHPNYVNMADIKTPPLKADVKAAEFRPAASLLYLREDEIRRGIELLFFAYRDFVAEADAELRKIGFGRAHHRALHFVGRNPCLPVGELLAILKITKQSLSRVLKDLVTAGHVVQVTGNDDRRQRLLRLTPEGEILLNRLASINRTRMVKAFREAGPDAVAGFRRVLTGLIAEEDRAAVMKLVERP